MRLAVLCLSFATAIACTTGGTGPRRDSGTPPAGDASAPPGGSLRIEPLDAQVRIVDGAPAVVEFRAFLVAADGSEQEVTSQAQFSSTIPDLGTFTGATFVSGTTRGGLASVQARHAGLVGTTTITVRIAQTAYAPGTTAADRDRFMAADDPSRAPELVYPPDGTVVPPNLNELEFHFRPSGGDVFELSFAGNTSEVLVYLNCDPLAGGCAYTPGEAVWRAVAQSEAGQGPVTYRLRGTSRSGGGVGASAPRTIEFAEEPITGGLYYWNAGAGAVRRYDFGRRGQRAENFIDRSTAGAMTCVGCHAISRDGRRIAVGADIPSPSPYGVYDVASRSRLYQQGSAFGGGGANFFTFSPDSSQIMTSNGLSIVLRDAASGNAITDPLVANGAMPDWSPDGDRMVYARPGTAPPCFPPFCGAPGVDGASLETMVRSGGTWAPGPQLVPPGGQNNYYPAFSPDGEWVLFNRSPSNANSMDAPDAQVWVVRATGGAPVHLARASTGGDSWPKWDVTEYQHRGHPLFWLTFSSRRAYGLRLAASTQAQIWMTAFDPTRPGDPSAPAFWLPFQEMDSGNHIAQWVTRVERQSCTNDSQCLGGEFCQEGVCVPDLI